MRLALFCLALAVPAQEWRYYGGDAGGNKYSPLTEINKTNVRQLRPAWIFDSGDWSDAKNASARSAFETTPIVVDGVMYVSTSFHRLFALDADTGKVLWEFDPKFDRQTRVTLHFSRGVTYWKNRILLGTQEGKLYSINAATGKPDPTFAADGMLDLRKGFTDKFARTPYGLTSPVTVCRDTIVTGAWVADGEPRGPAGDIRGWDARTGKQKWTFHTVPRPGEFGHDTWTQPDSWKDRGGANAWSIMSADEKLGLVYVPLTSPATDIYGGDRHGANLFGDSLVALDCETGTRRWHFQTVHHNVWDYDLPAQPILMTMGKVDAVAQITKTGFVFAFDRATGKPLFPIEERPVPKSPIPGEQSSPTQPFPVKPPPFARQSFRMSELTSLTPESRNECIEKLKGAEAEGDLYRPVTEKPTVFFPGTNGGANWGGGSFDPSTSTLYVNAMDVAAFMQLTARPNDPTIPFRSRGFGRFWDSNLYPCQQPPWGSLTAIDMSKGEFRWRSVLGEYDELTAKGIPKTGASNLGGSIVTAGGLVFIAATNDSKFRAFDKDTGKELWVTRLPASGHATPMTYRGKSGRQYVVIAAGGGNKYTNQFNPNIDAKLVAFALPRKGDPAEPRLVTSYKAVMRQGYTGRGEEKVPAPVAPQPVAFSHKVHAAAKCTDCHKTALTAARATIPNAKDCMACHPARKMDRVDWTRVYQLPGFVFFSHARHAKVDCASCHGPVQTRDILMKEVSTSMNACMDCHVKQKASTACHVCHELGQ